MTSGLKGGLVGGGGENGGRGWFQHSNFTFSPKFFFFGGKLSKSTPHPQSKNPGSAPEESTVIFFFYREDAQGLGGFELDNFHNFESNEPLRIWILWISLHP